MTIYKTLRFDDTRGDLIRWLLAKPRTYNSEDVVDGVTLPDPDARGSSTYPFGRSR
jgi:hypothetical protein